MKVGVVVTLANLASVECWLEMYYSWAGEMSWGGECLLPNLMTLNLIYCPPMVEKRPCRLSSDLHTLPVGACGSSVPAQINVLDSLKKDTHIQPYILNTLNSSMGGPLPNSTWLTHTSF